MSADSARIQSRCCLFVKVQQRTVASDASGTLVEAGVSRVAAGLQSESDSGESGTHLEAD